MFRNLYVYMYCWLPIYGNKCFISVLKRKYFCNTLQIIRLIIKTKRILFFNRKYIKNNSKYFTTKKRIQFENKEYK